MNTETEYSQSTASSLQHQKLGFKKEMNLTHSISKLAINVMMWFFRVAITLSFASKSSCKLFINSISEAKRVSNYQNIIIFYTFHKLIFVKGQNNKQ